MQKKYSINLDLTEPIKLKILRACILHTQFMREKMKKNVVFVNWKYYLSHNTFLVTFLEKSTNKKSSLGVLIRWSGSLNEFNKVVFHEYHSKVKALIYPNYAKKLSLLPQTLIFW